VNVYVETIGMKRPRNRPVVLTCVLGGVLALSLARSAFSPERRTGGEDTTANQPDLEGRHRELARQVRQKVTLVRSLIDGHRTFPQTAEEFRRLDEADRYRWETMHRSNPGKSDEELLCLSVLGYAGAILQEPSERQRVMTRLEAEADEYLDPAGRSD
jgi:hypothetical protein